MEIEPSSIAEDVSKLSSSISNKNSNNNNKSIQK